MVAQPLHVWTQHFQTSSHEHVLLSLLWGLAVYRVRPPSREVPMTPELCRAAAGPEPVGLWSLCAGLDTGSSGQPGSRESQACGPSAGSSCWGLPKAPPPSQSFSENLPRKQGKVTGEAPGQGAEKLGGGRGAARSAPGIQGSPAVILAPGAAVKHRKASGRLVSRQSRAEIGRPLRRAAVTGSWGLWSRGPRTSEATVGARGWWEAARSQCWGRLTVHCAPCMGQG